MALIWIVTIGNSDVKLTSDDGWGNLREGKRKDLNPCYRDFKRPTEEPEGFFSLPARVLGVVYGNALDTHWQYFCFPLLSEFTKTIKSDKKNKPDRIVVLLTDQEQIFLDTNTDSLYNRSDSNCPYWKDTCTLEPILQHYFDNEFGLGKVKFSKLEPKKVGQGLDHWNETLYLVQHKFPEWGISEGDRIIVSHQAGTPAISSAVQFCSLAKFGDRVEFLVSNEYNPTLPEKLIQGSIYLRGIRIQEAKALLNNHNYAGVKTLIGDYIQENEEIKALLNAAKNWNVAKFSNFLDCLQEYPKFSSEVAERKRKENWWWIGYEEAYLAVIREKQDNIVEAFFHSFRAFEYIFAAWGSKNFSNHIENKEDEDTIPVLMDTFLEDPHYLKLSAKSKKSISGIISKLEKRRRKLQIHNESMRVDIDTDVNIEEEVEKVEEVELVFFNLANLFKSLNYREYKNECPELEIFFGKDNVRDRRNLIIHQAKGLSITDLCDYWKILIPEKDDERKKSVKQWSDKLLKLLNFIAKDDLEEGFSSLEAASLMAIVHQELEQAIANL